jgi:hypothetical protein
LDDDLQLARAAAEAALATEGVYSLGTGRYVEAATYGPGEKVTGVVVGPDEVRVHIVVSYPPPSRYRPSPSASASGRPREPVDGPLTVVVEDLEVVRDENL